MFALLGNNANGCTAMLLWWQQPPHPKNSKLVKNKNVLHPFQNTSFRNNYTNVLIFPCCRYHRLLQYGRRLGCSRYPVCHFSSASTVHLLSWQVNVLYCNTIWKAATFNDKLYHITLCKLWLVRRVLVGCMFSIFSAKQAQVFLPHRLSLGLATWPVASAWLLVKDMRVVLILQSSLQQEPQRLSPDFKNIYSTPLPE